MGLIPCPTCRRHVRLEENACPFCGNAAPIGGFAAIAAAAALALAGCGGKSKAQEPPENKGDPAGEVTPDAGVDEPAPLDDRFDDLDDRGGDVQPEYGIDIY